MWLEPSGQAGFVGYSKDFSFISQPFGDQELIWCYVESRWDGASYCSLLSGQSWVSWLWKMAVELERSRGIQGTCQKLKSVRFMRAWLEGKGSGRIKEDHTGRLVGQQYENVIGLLRSEWVGPVKLFWNAWSLMTWFGLLCVTMPGFYRATTELWCQSPVSLLDPLLLFYTDNLKHRVTGS